MPQTFLELYESHGFNRFDINNPPDALKDYAFVEFDREQHVVEHPDGSVEWIGPVGLFLNVPEELYHKLPYCSNSRLNHFGKTALHAKYALENLDSFQSTRAMMASSIRHWALLEPKRFDASIATIPSRLPKISLKHRIEEEDFGSLRILDADTLAGLPADTGAKEDPVWEDLNMRTKRHQALRDALYLKYGEEQIWKADEKTEVERMVASMIGHERYGAAIRAMIEGATEVTVIFDYPIEIGGVMEVIRFKCRIDSIGTDGVVRDAKFVVSAAPGYGKLEFGRAIAEKGYHRQTVIYVSGLSRLGYPPPPVRLVAVEKEPPYVMEEWTLDADTITEAGNQVVKRVTMYALGTLRNHWPGYVPSENKGQAFISLPPWAFEESH